MRLSNRNNADALPFASLWSSWPQQRVLGQTIWPRWKISRGLNEKKVTMGNNIENKSFPRTQRRIASSGIEPPASNLSITS